MPRNRPRKNKSGPRRRSGWKRLLFFAALACFLAVAAVSLVYAFWASSFNIEAVKEMPQRSTVYDMDGKIYSRLQGENRLVVPLSQVSRHFIEALLAREDARFYGHRGVDPIGIARAIIRNLGAGSATQGASTLTQQLARNSFPERIGQRKSIHRKLLEAFVAARIEQRYKKDEILEHYVNRIYFGSGVYGVEAASMAYFGKRAHTLTLNEAAMIAGIIRGPTRFSPFTNPKGATRERNVVLDRLVKLKKITPEVAGKTKSMPLAVSKRRPLMAQQNYAMDAVAQDLNILLTDEQRAEGGLRIYTTIDPELQKKAAEAVDGQLRKIEARQGYNHPKRADFSEQAKDDEQPTPYLQGALVLIDNRTGAIRALVGGRDYSESPLNRALKSKRQIGSTFKPFVYAAGFSRGLLPGSTISDDPIAPGEIRAAANWTPDNSDGKYKGPLRLEEGLIQSRNTMSVRVGERTGLDVVAQVAENAGLLEVPRRPAIYLGAFEATLRDVTSAYSVFPNDGTRRQSYIIERIDDASGEIIYRAAHISRQILDPGVSWLVTSALRKAVERGTAASARKLGFQKPAAGKTGTTNDYRDAWFVGFTSSLTCGVWVGLDMPEPIIPRGYGAALALPIWAQVMNAAPTQRYPASEFRPEVPLQRVVVCSGSSDLATGGCERAGASYAADLPVSCSPRSACALHGGGGIIAGRREERPRRTSLPDNIFRSFRKFFGGN